MAKSILLKVLHDYFGKYIDGINEENLKLGIWAGQVDLHNLELNKHALDGLRLPLKVRIGHIDRLSVSIPWSRLGNDPVKVVIDGVYVSGVMLSEEEFGEVSENGRVEGGTRQRQELAMKRRRLQWAEVLERSTEGDQSSSSDDSFLSRLAAKIMDNLQVTITNIHVRFEDSVSFKSNAVEGMPKSTSVMGVTLKRFQAVTCDENGKPIFVATNGENKALKFKLVEIEALAIYWDVDEEASPSKSAKEVRSEMLLSIKQSEVLMEQESIGKEVVNQHTSVKGHRYLLAPCSPSLHVTKNDTADFSIPRYRLRLDFDRVSLGLNESQYEGLIALAQHISLYARMGAVSTTTSKPKVKINSDPQAWWRYAIGAVIATNKRKVKLRNWYQLSIMVLKRGRYVKLYRNKKLVANREKKVFSGKEENELMELEDELDLEDILAFRSQVVEELARKTTLQQKKSNSESANESAQQPSFGGWLSSWFKDDPSGQSEGSEDGITLTKEEQDELLNAVSYVEATERYAVPLGSPFTLVESKLRSCSFALFKRDGSPVSNALLSGKHRLETCVGDSWNMGLQLSTFVLRDLGSSVKSVFPLVVSPKNLTSPTDSDDFILDVQVGVKNPENEEHTSLSVRALPIRLVLVPEFAHMLYKFFDSPLIREASSSAVSALQVWGDATQQDVLELLSSHKSVRLTVDIAAPIITFPIPDPNSETDKRRLLVCDLGEFNTKSVKIDADCAASPMLVVAENLEIKSTDDTLKPPATESSKVHMDTIPRDGSDTSSLSSDEGFFDALTGDDQVQSDVKTSGGYSTSSQKGNHETAVVRDQRSSSLIIESNEPSKTVTSGNAKKLGSNVNTSSAESKSSTTSLAKGAHGSNSSQFCSNGVDHRSILKMHQELQESEMENKTNEALGPPYDSWVIGLRSTTVLLVEYDGDGDIFQALDNIELKSKTLSQSTETVEVHKYYHLVDHIDVSLLLQTSIVPSARQVARTRAVVNFQSIRVHLAPVLFESLDYLLESYRSLDWGGPQETAPVTLEERKGSVPSYQPTKLESVTPDEIHMPAPTQGKEGKYFANVHFNMNTFEMLVSRELRNSNPFEVEPLLFGRIDRLEMRFQQRQQDIRVSMRLKSLKVEDLFAPPVVDGQTPVLATSLHSPQVLGLDKALEQVDLIQLCIDVKPRVKGKFDAAVDADFKFNSLHVEWHPETMIVLLRAFSTSAGAAGGGPPGPGHRRRGSSAKDLLQDATRPLSFVPTPVTSAVRAQAPPSGRNTATQSGPRTRTALSLCMTLKALSLSFNKQEESQEQVEGIVQREILLVAMQDTKLRFEQTTEAISVSGEMGNIHCLVPAGKTPGSTEKFVNIFSSKETTKRELIEFSFHSPLAGVELDEFENCNAKLSVTVSPSLLIYSQQCTLEVTDYFFQGVLGVLQLGGGDDALSFGDLEEESTAPQSFRLELHVELAELQVVLPRTLDQFALHSDIAKCSGLIASCHALKVTSSFQRKEETRDWMQTIVVDVSKMSAGTLPVADNPHQDELVGADSNAVQSRFRDMEPLVEEEIALLVSISQPLTAPPVEAKTVLISCDVNISDIKLNLRREQYYTVNGVLNDNIFSDPEFSSPMVPTPTGASATNRVEYHYAKNDEPPLTFEIRIHFITASIRISEHSKEELVALLSLRQSEVKFQRFDDSPVTIEWTVRAMDLVDLRPETKDNFFKHLILSCPESSVDSSQSATKNAFRLHFVPEKQVVSVTLMEFVSVFMLDLFVHVLDFVLTTEPPDSNAKRSLPVLGDDVEADQPSFGWSGEFNLVRSQLCFTDDLSSSGSSLIAIQGDIAILWSASGSGDSTSWRISCTSLQAYGKRAGEEERPSNMTFEQQVLLNGPPTHQIVEPTSFTVDYLHEIESKLAKITSRQLRVDLKQTEVFLSLTDISTIRAVVEMLSEQQMAEFDRQKVELGRAGVQYESENPTSPSRLYSSQLAPASRADPDHLEVSLKTTKSKRSVDLLTASTPKTLRSFAKKAKEKSSVTANALKGRIAKAKTVLPFRSSSSTGASKKRFSAIPSRSTGDALRDSESRRRTSTGQLSPRNSPTSRSARDASPGHTVKDSLDLSTELALGSVPKSEVPFTIPNASIGRVFCDHTKVEVECFNLQGFEDLGISLKQTFGYAVVTSLDTADLLSPRILLQSPVQVGDILVKVNEKNVLTENLDSIENLLVGTVTLTFHKGESEEPIVLKDTFDISSRLLVIYLIDDNDSKDLPLVYLNFSKVDAFVNGSTVGNYVCGMQLVVAMQYYSLSAARWELLMSPWETNVSCTMYQNGNTDFVVGASNSLSFHLPDSFLETLHGLTRAEPEARGRTEVRRAKDGLAMTKRGISKLLSARSLGTSATVAVVGQEGGPRSNKAVQALNQLLEDCDASSAVPESHTPKPAPFVVRNYLGMEVLLEKLDPHMETGDMRYMRLAPRASQYFRFNHAKGAGAGVLRTYIEPRHVSLELDGGLWEPASGVRVNRAGGSVITLRPRRRAGSRPFQAEGVVVVPPPAGGLGFGVLHKTSNLLVRSADPLPPHPQFKFKILGAHAPKEPGLLDHPPIDGVSFETHASAQDDFSFSLKTVFGGTSCPRGGIVVSWTAVPSVFPCHQKTVQEHLSAAPPAHQAPLPPLPPLHLWCQVELLEGRLELTLRSLVKVVNHTALALDVLVHSPHWSSGPEELPACVGPGETMHVPLLLSDASEVRFRPTGRQLGWSQAVYDSLRHRGGTSKVECRPVKGSNRHGTHLHVQVTASGDGRRVQFNVHPSLVVRNLLPVGVEVDQLLDRQHVARSVIGAGQDCQSAGLPSANAHARLRVRLAGEVPSRWSRAAALVEVLKRSRSEDDVLPGLALDIHALDGPDLAQVQLQYEDVEAEGAVLVIYSPYWLINRTMLPLRFRAKPGNGEKPGPWVDSIGINRAPGGIVMFSPSQGRMQFSVADSPPGQSFAIDKPGLSGCVTVPHGNVLETNYDVGVSVDIGSGMLYRTNLVTFVPRYVLLNRTALVEPLSSPRGSSRHFVGMGPDSNAPPTAPETVHRVALRFAGMEDELVTVPQGDCVPFWGAPNFARTGEARTDKRIARTLQAPYSLQICVSGQSSWSPTFTVESLMNLRRPRVFELANLAVSGLVHQLQVSVRAGDAAASICIEVKELPPVLPAVRSPRTSQSGVGMLMPMDYLEEGGLASQGVSDQQGMGEQGDQQRMVEQGGQQGMEEQAVSIDDEQELNKQTEASSEWIPVNHPELSGEKLTSDGPQLPDDDIRLRQWSIRVQIPVITLRLLANVNSTDLTAENTMQEITGVDLHGLHLSVKTQAHGTVDQTTTVGLKLEELMVQDLANTSRFRVVAHGGQRARASGPVGQDFVRVLIVNRFHPMNYVFDKFKVGVGQVLLQLDERFIEMMVDKYKCITRGRKQSWSASSHLLGESPAAIAIRELQHLAREEVAVAYLGSPETQEKSSMSNRHLYFRELLFTDLAVKLSYQQHPDPSTSSKLYDLGGGLLSRMKLRVDGAKFRLNRFSANYLFISPGLLASSIGRHYTEEAKAQMMDILRSVSIRGTDWGITSTLMKTFVGEEIVSKEFSPVNLSNSEIVSKYRRQIQGLDSLEQFLVTLRNLVFDWRFNHRGLNSRRCIVVGLVNRSNVEIRFEPVLLQGSGCHTMLAQRPKVLQTSLLSREEQLVLQPWEGMWDPKCSALLLAYGFLSEKVDLRVVSRGFKARFQDVHVAMASTPTFSTSFLHKDPNPWYSSYVIVVDNVVV